ncbi:MAG TPA: hypothetical protein VKF42_07070 [Chitinivibrionales bacterium]|jgi:glutaredoxin|nr:hypothetical protein [Chitinivibrionales bacterium]
MKTNRTFPCPACGGEVRVGAKSCPHCGSDERTGWSDKTYLDGIDLGDDVDYEELREQEFGTAGIAKRKVSWVAVVAAILLALALAGFIKMLL